MTLFTLAVDAPQTIISLNTLYFYKGLKMAQKLVIRKGKLTLKEIEVILDRLKHGTQFSNIATEFGISEEMVGKVKDGTYGKRNKKEEPKPADPILNAAEHMKTMESSLLESAHKIVDEFDLKKKGLNFEIGVLQQQIEVVNKNPDYIRARELIRTLEVGLTARPT